ncbi:hypothetical protein KP509_30G013500 [Ceratopteris richardii]|uniref:RING-type E3 ubiquitin transferase n=1 Tax=Ceratopteris richardii TaxID=49495 RepID=A0A8T2R275_CERRI|nr:hypothetical protein KP509_30G013500 [Ceratopteris richardii]
MRTFGCRKWFHAAVLIFGAHLTFCAFQSNPLPAHLVSSVIEYRSEYNRSDEVQKHCKSHLADLSYDACFRKDLEAKKWVISNELSFLNGEWQEVSGNKPLMPSLITFVNTSKRLVENRGFRLASFWVTDVDVASASSSQGNMVNVSAVLQVGVSTWRSLSYMSNEIQDFEVYPGSALLSIFTEGVYAELRTGERIFCLLGSSRLPVRGKDSSQPWDWLDPVMNGAPSSPTLVNDSQLKVVLHFPNDLTLTTRQVSGRLESLHDTSESLYFNPVDLFSQLGTSSNYRFQAGAMFSRACGNREIQPGEILRPPSVYMGKAFCTVVRKLLGSWVDVLPNWNCTTSNGTCSKFGPFLYPKEEESAMMEGFNGSQLLVQEIRCVDYRESDGSYGANMSAVIRAVLSTQNKNLGFERSNLDSLTLAAEGKWNSRSGELCMIGCRGGNKKPVCEMRIRMFIPLILSLKQRSVLVGSISGLKTSPEVFYPLSFHVGIQPLQHLPFVNHAFQPSVDVVSSMSYKYTKIEEAKALRQEDDSSGMAKKIRKSLLVYPSVEDDIMRLFDDLSLGYLAITNPNSPKELRRKQYIKLDVLAIKEHVSLDRLRSFGYSHSNATVYHKNYGKRKAADAEEPYDVAAQLEVMDGLGKKIAAFSAEGQYDPTLGRMYLVGCREVDVPWETLKQFSEQLQNGLDCSIKLKVEYPPTNARWFMNPTVLLTVTSSRSQDDPLFFTRMELRTFPILYTRQREEIVSRKNLEGGLNMLTSSLILGCLISQLIYVKSHAESTPYISLLMLALQGLGFSFPLITGVEALFARRTSYGEDMRNSVFDRGFFLSPRNSVWNEGQRGHIIGYMVNLFTLAALFLTMRIIQKVYSSRRRLLSRRSLEPWRVPNDKKVGAICLGIHILGFVTVLIIHTIRLSQRPVSSAVYMDWHGGVHRQYDWERILKEYYGLVQDLFLLPQVVGNHIWVVRGKPLRSLFYVGVTVLRLLPHFYDSLRPQVFNPYFADEFQYANPNSDFYSKTGDITIPLLAVALALVVYIQQRWNGLQWAKVLRQGFSKLIPISSKMYERLPSKTFEAEMVESGADQIYDNGHFVASTES